MHMRTCNKSKFNNTAHLLAVKFLAVFSQPTHTIVSYSLLLHGPLVSLTKFLGSCAQASCKLTARFSSLSSLLSSTSASSQLTTHYNTCSNNSFLSRLAISSKSKPNQNKTGQVITECCQERLLGLRPYIEKLHGLDPRTRFPTRAY